LYAQEKMFGAIGGNVDGTSNITKVKAFLNSNDTNKDYNKQSDLFVKLTMF